MKIRTRLTLQYSAVTAIVLLLLMAVIYVYSENNRKATFARELQREAITKAQLFLNGNINPETMHSIYDNNKNFIDEVQVAIYEKPFNLIYHDAGGIDYLKETPEMLAGLDSTGCIDMFIGKYQAIAMPYSYEGKEYIVTATAFDGYGKSYVQDIRNTIVILSLIGLTLLLITGLALSYMALRPIRTIISGTRQITANRFSRRLPLGTNRDEIYDISKSINELLDRLEMAFNSQKMFVSNVSHELRTPMAALTSELEISLFKERDAEQYRQSIQHALNDAHRITRLVDGLLNMAKADYAPERIKMKETRVDELLLDAVHLIKRAHTDYHIDILFENESDNEADITLQANAYLLTTAFINLIENNCKFSTNRKSVIQISEWKRMIVLRFSDNGIGIPDKDKQRIFQAFHRGENHTFADGHGIGMTLAKKIIELHGGRIEVFSSEGEGTTFTVHLPHV